ncbi:MAG TPA: class I SAM-dependent methyltransferase [Gammaproteobacteria bacterium]|nr:class I SAM-dependent methyltransferase [Gammaproteobacteria bacterium]
MAVDPDKLNATLLRMIGDVAAAASGSLIVLGERLGLFKALAESGPLTSEALAAKLKLTERYVREWLHAMVAGEYVQYDGARETYSMSPEQIACLADPDSPAMIAGGYYGIMSLYLDEPKIEDAFKTGKGVGWGEHHRCLFCGAEKFFGPGYKANLIDHWLPQLDGVVDKLQRGARVADVGCGHALSTRLMARAFPNSEFVGIDSHAPSIAHATELAANWGLSNVRFSTASSSEFDGSYDLVAFFDCLHDMGDPTAIARHVRQHLAPGGTWMVVEPAAADELAHNINPVSRAFYAFSTMVCVPVSLSQPGRVGLGAQAGAKRLTEVITAGGFGNVRLAASSPTNLVLEARI